MLKGFVFLVNFYFVFATPSLRASTCTSGCDKLSEEKINVHIVPHSHDDVGRLKTYDEYYTGTGKFDSAEDAGVKYILDSTIQALSKNKDRRFVQVETAFFFKWWNDQNQETRDLVKNLVNEGRLEMINGGWSMNDEATAHYHSIIDQFTWGFRILEETVGECGRPKIGWQIDPYGHSREHASIVKQLGFDGLVVGRLDYRDKAKRIQEKNLDFIWNTNDNFEEEDAKIFTTMFPDFYVDETGFCFDVYCNDQNITDDNLEERVKTYKVILDKYKDYYKTSNILIPMGQDFGYQKADKNFDNIDKLIKGFKDDDTYNVIYSTPSCYIQAVKDEVEKNKIELTVKTDDFFPYASKDHSFWTGYFSSRPTAKRFERVGNNILQSAKQLTTFSRIKGNDDDVSINKLRMAMGVWQHHDAITGTEKQAVADDYTLMLDEAIKDTEKPLSKIVSGLLVKDDSASVDLNLVNCLRANMSICDNSKKDRFVVAIQNPLSKNVSHYVRLPVDNENYKITGPEDDGDITFDIFDTIHPFDFVTDGEPATKELVFLAKDLPPLGVKLYYVEKIDDASDKYRKFEDIADVKSFGDDNNGFTIDDNGKLATVTINGKLVNLQQDFLYYKGMASDQASGAYIFRPDGSAIPINEKLTTVKYAQGSLVDEVYQVFDDEITQIIKVYKEEEDSYLEFDWLVGNLQVDSEGKEIITRFTIIEAFENNEIFYTDGNGRQQMKRIRNKRNDYSYDDTEEPISSNYYPVTNRIVIRDESTKLELAVLTDRPQGGSSLDKGVVELMVHRRDTKDDEIGVAEVLNEQQYNKGLYARGQHYLTFGKLEPETSPVTFERDLARRNLLAPVVLVGDATGDGFTLEKVQATFNFKFEALSKSLDDNVHILTLEPWKDSYLLRLEHIFEKNEDATLSTDAEVDLENLFTQFNITELKSVTLGANGDPGTVEGLKVTLKPMEIKSFVFITDKENKGGHDIGIRGTSSSAQALTSLTLLTLLISVFYSVF
ncbi:hypothetical protein Zmor_007917 [Zophobas morio]|uniref:Alpha-mannosidase n=1 Tax=Zophobas morio TaxID=2755281 RepID=A0AA38J001_9CUCU|nr:hypothetical protein Zmor_007917 [Zophobas morio]